MNNTRSRAQEKYKSLKVKNSMQIDLTLTLGKLKVVRSALEWQKSDMLKKRMGHKPENRTPSCEYDTTIQLLDKISKVIAKSSQ